MRGTDVAVLVAFVAELQPAQRFSEYTPDAWAMVLADVPADLETAKAAVVRLAKRSTWFTPGEVRTEIRKAIPPSQLLAPAPARKELDWSPESAEARRERAAHWKAVAAADVQRRGFKPVKPQRPAAATNPKVAAALAKHRAQPADGDPENPAPGMEPADATAAAIESVKNAVTEYRKASS
jgi:hypothetical protein